MTDYLKYLSVKNNDKIVGDSEALLEWNKRKWVWITDPDSKNIFLKANIIDDKGVYNFFIAV
jgi:hypothetical protein